MTIYNSSEHLKEIFEVVYKAEEFDILKSNFDNFWTIRSYGDKFEFVISESEKKKLDRTNYYVITLKEKEEWIKRLKTDDDKYEMIMLRLCMYYEHLSETDKNEVQSFMKNSKSTWRRVNNNWIELKL